jgi:uncharacterized protein (UPF0332 family)
MTWVEIGKSHLSAAKSLRVSHPRSSISRSYYAAHVALAQSLFNSGYAPVNGRQTQPHQSQAKLIGIHLAHFTPNAVKELRAVTRRLYARRIDADYKRNMTVDAATASQSLQDVSTLFYLLGVQYP